ncbi:DUF6044 family protein [Dysgonomonas sp. GY617]|uniref:DUF6044 family protein n=1 Tax=Dysgonomonas sp. GY617 TaxID=2780420 RepID=UPI00188320B6|nr:DUF6044 family protein [Dysgonomonas sp. GY617]MBF0574952.1 hypothetical protein [Dysgonomonas sp. GY617]
MRVFLKERNLILFSLVLITLVFLPYVYLGEDVHLRLHDNMDSNIVWVKIILESGGFFLSPAAIVEQVMNGIPHSCVWGTYDLSLLFFDFFGIFWGYVFNKYLMALIGFLGMFLLLKKHFLSDTTPSFIPIGVAVLFSLLPFWSFMASISGLPIVLYAFMNLRNREVNVTNWLILVLYGFYSSLVLVGFFLFIVLTFLWIADLVRTKKINYPFSFGIIFLLIIYIISHLPLFWSFFYDSGFVSQRVELKTGQAGFMTVFRRLLLHGDETLGSNHAISLQTYFLIPAIVIAFFFMLKNKVPNRKFLGLVIYIVVSSAWFAYLGWDSALKEKLMLIFPLDIRRFNWLQPLCWYLLFGISLSYIYSLFKNKVIATVLIMIVFIFQFIFLLKYQEYNLYENKNYSFRKYYAEAQFKEIGEFIGKNKEDYRIISVGIEPAISQFNGFYTLDGYFPNYPLSYKHQFGKVIEPELKKNMGLYNFFHNWGSKCYAFCSVLYYPMQDLISGEPVIEHLDFDYGALKEMGGEYIISSREINVENNREIRLESTFEHEDSYWKLYLYKVL